MSSERKDYVIVVGAGAAGLSAAISASENGDSIVLEKAPDIKDTNTSRSGGAIAIAKDLEMFPDKKRRSAEELVQLSNQISGGFSIGELVAGCRNKIDETIEWLKDLGIRLMDKPIFLERHISIQTMGMGRGLNNQLLEFAQRKGAKILFNHKAKTLLTDDYGKVVGVKAMTPSGLKNFLGKGVVLATAGFQANQEMLIKYFGDDFVYGTKLTGSPFSTGDGHIMAKGIGAKLINMTQFHCRQIDRRWIPGTAGLMGPRQIQPYNHYGIFINKLGKRFMDEYGEFARSNSVSCSILKQPDRQVAFLFDEEIKKMMGERFKQYDQGEEIIKKVDSIVDVARIIGAPVQTLTDVIQEYNKAVGEKRAHELDVPRTHHAHELNPPYYVLYPVWSGLNCTLGGPLINTDGQVLDVDDKPISGLYAAGEMVGGIFFGNYKKNKDGSEYYEGTYQVVTSSLSACIVYGRIAGKNAASL